MFRATVPVILTALSVAGCGDLVTNSKYEKDLKKLAAQMDLDKARQAVSRTQQAIQQLDQNVNARLALETMLLSWDY